MDATIKKEGKIFYGWWIVLGSVLITATIVPSVMALANKFLIPVTTEMGISRSAFTLSNAILQAMGIFFAPLATKKIAKGDLKKIQSISILIFGLVFATYGFAQSPVHFYISSIILGFSYLFASIIPISLMITNWFEEKRGLAMSIAFAGIGVGGFIFSPLITKWLTIYGWRSTYIRFAIVMLVVSLPVSLFIFAKSPEDKGLKPYGYKENKDVKGKSSNTSFKLGLSTKESFSKSFFILLMLGMIFNGLINTGALGQFPPALEELHGPATAAKIISLYSLIGIFGKLFLGWVNDKFGVIKSAILGCITFGLAFLAMLFGESLSVIYMMTIVFGLGNAIGTVLPPLLTSSIFEPEKYGEVYGYISSATQIGLTFGSLLVASIYDLSNSYRIAWIVMMALTAGTLFTWILAYKKSLKYRV